MKKYLLFVVFSLLVKLSDGQHIDTLNFFSESFKDQRTVYIQTPQYFRYQSDKVKLPVIYILDGQHEWFVNPILNTVKYLQETYDMPAAILVIVPLKDRYKECGIRNFIDTLPLHKFITRELSDKVKKYNPNGFNLMIGHSFSASFAMYSYLKAPQFYGAIFANSPGDAQEQLVQSLNNDERINKKSIYLSVGGIDRSKDTIQRSIYDKLKLKYPQFYSSITTFEANSATHSAVPIISDPIFLSKLFEPFRSRYIEIGKVDYNYKFISPPLSIENELSKIDKNSKLLGMDYAIELPDINGFASRYSANNLNDYAIAIYKKGLEFYPNYYRFYYSVGELYNTTDRVQAKRYFEKALTTFNNYEKDNADRERIRADINMFLKN